MPYCCIEVQEKKKKKKLDSLIDYGRYIAYRISLTVPNEREKTKDYEISGTGMFFTFIWANRLLNRAVTAVKIHIIFSVSSYQKNHS
jgi:hypothetical protein